MALVPVDYVTSSDWMAGCRRYRAVPYKYRLHSFFKRGALYRQQSVRAYGYLTHVVCLSERAEPLQLNTNHEP